MKKLLILVLSLYVMFLTAATTEVAAQEQTNTQVYQFTDIVRNPVTSVKDQNYSGTCWCFSTISFLEAELLKAGKGSWDLSELFVVRHNYYDRLNDNYLRRGKGNIGEGSITHMALRQIKEHGVVPQDIYSGINYDSELPDHLTEFTTYIEAIANASVKVGNRSEEYFELQDALFDIYMGPLPESFIYEGKEYTPITFRDKLGINTDDYIEITSFTHHPFYQQVPLEIPDNWDHALLYNLPLDDFMRVIDNALENGYTVNWDGDVSENGYVFNPHGIAVIPAQADLTKREIATSATIIEEIDEITPELRQEWFETFVTTDDHLEHIIGIAQDQNGTRYYITKNSWGESGPFAGYHYMSEKYVRAKTVSIVVNKKGLPKDIKKKLGL